jgi:hypothetical protein
MWLLKFHACVTLLENYAGSKEESCKIMGMKMLTALGKARLNADYIRGLRLAAIKPTAIEVTETHL